MTDAPPTGKAPANPPIGKGARPLTDASAATP